MKFEQRDHSGLLVPQAKPEPPKPPEPFSLALEDEGDRTTAWRALQTLFGLTDHGGGIRFADSDKDALRQKLIVHLAELLLGDGVEFEVKT